MIRFALLLTFCVLLSPVALALGIAAVISMARLMGMPS